jgi:hypothetical protein
MVNAVSGKGIKVGFPEKRESTGIGRNDAKERAMRVSVLRAPKSMPTIGLAAGTWNGKAKGEHWWCLPQPRRPLVIYREPW